MTAYYNEIDPKAAQWLRNLIDAGHIAPGIVDERSIEDVYPSDLRGFTQCHFFAGIGVWSHALRQAGWTDDRPVWTGSCPCQPFSAAGKGAGFDDERHLWPAFHHLIKECSPAIVFGEQVASKYADAWIDLVHTDLEAMGYAFGAVAFPSAGVGAPHIRDRSYWVANASRTGIRAKGLGSTDAETRGFAGEAGKQRVRVDAGAGGPAVFDWLADARKHHRGPQAAPADHGQPQANRSADWVGGCGGVSGILGNAGSAGLAQCIGVIGIPGGASGGNEGQATERAGIHAAARPGPTNGFWAASDWLGCRDGKWRPVEPGTFPLVNGAPARVVRLRAYGNAINAKAAQAFIECAMDGD